jgi:hypothetical protein
MKKRISDLLNEMQGIFGGSFGSDAGSLTESHELSEGPGRRQGKPAMNRPMPSDKGKVKGKGGGRNFPGRGKSGKKSSKASGYGSAEKISRLAKAASMKNKDPKKQADQEKRYKRAVDAEAGKKSKGGGGITGTSDKRDTTDRKASPGGSGGKKNNPFRNSSSRGKGPGAPKTGKQMGEPGPMQKQDSKTGCWNCDCKGGTYAKDGCECTSSGSGKNCPPKGTVKMIKIKQSYHRAYNDHYHAWKRKHGGPQGRK